MEGTPNPAPNDIYVLQCSKKLEGPFHYLGAKDDWHYYLFLDGMFEIGDAIKKYNKETGVIAFQHINPEIKVRMPWKSDNSLLDCLLAIHEKERIVKGWA